MNPKHIHNPARHQCESCGGEPSIIHTISNDGVLRRLCTDCLLKEQWELFCPFCLEVFVDGPPLIARVICHNCSSVTHLACSPPPPPPSSSSSAGYFFKCPPCSDPNFTFFPKPPVPSSDRSEDDDNTQHSGTFIDLKSAKALAAAAKIASVSLSNRAAELRKKANEKIREAKEAKRKATEALSILQDLVNKQKASKNANLPTKRKIDDR